MLLVKTNIGPSQVHGTGVFAAEHILSRTIVWHFVPGKDVAHTKEEAEKLPEPKRSEILGLRHSCISKQTGRYISFGDCAGYLNHSPEPNLGTRYETAVEEDINFWSTRNFVNSGYNPFNL